VVVTTVFAAATYKGEVQGLAGATPLPAKAAPPKQAAAAPATAGNNAADAQAWIDAFRAKK